jgi:hypothetical protein
VLPSGDDAAAGDLEDDAAVGVEPRAVAFRARVVEPDHPAVVGREDLLQLRR